MKQIIRFGIVGTIGFCVDALILLLGVNILLFSIEVSRLLSFLCAVFVTWLLNRNFTFSKNQTFSKKKEYILYLTIQSFGALLNYSIFIFLININKIFEENLVLTLAIASLIAMFFNFLVIRKKIYN